MADTGLIGFQFSLAFLISGRKSQLVGSHYPALPAVLIVSATIQDTVGLYGQLVTNVWLIRDILLASVIVCWLYLHTAKRFQFELNVTLVFVFY